MIDVALLKVVGFGSLALLVMLWLVISFLAPGKARRRVSWVAATCMYLALLCLFVNLFQEAFHAESLVGMIAFGFLGVIFLCGVVVSTAKTLGQLLGRSSRSGPVA